jgi:hypothetical protein
LIGATDSFDIHYEHHFAAVPVSHACSGLPHRHGFTMFASRTRLLANVFIDFEDRSFAWLYPTPVLATVCGFLAYSALGLLLLVSLRFGSFAYATVAVLALLNVNNLLMGASPLAHSLSPDETPFECPRFVKEEIYDVLQNESLYIAAGRLPPGFVGHLTGGYPSTVHYQCTEAWPSRMKSIRGRTLVNLSGT